MEMYSVGLWFQGCYRRSHWFTRKDTALSYAHKTHTESEFAAYAFCHAVDEEGRVDSEGVKLDFEGLSL